MNDNQWGRNAPIDTKKHDKAALVAGFFGMVGIVVIVVFITHTYGERIMAFVGGI